MGSIDVDPASSKLAQAIVRAGIYYTFETNGLAHRWVGNVWLNPPYAARIITAFTDKLLGHIATGDVRQAILLTHNNTDTAWFHKVVECCCLLCFTRGRVRFYDERGQANSPTHGHTFIYFGRRQKRFASEFRKWGFILKPQKA